MTEKLKTSIPKMGESFQIIKEQTQPKNLSEAQKIVIGDMHTAVDKLAIAGHDVGNVKSEILGLISLLFVITCDPKESRNIKIERSLPTIIGQPKPKILSGKQEGLIDDMHKAVSELANGGHMGKIKGKLIGLIGTFFDTTCVVKKQQNTKPEKE